MEEGSSRLMKLEGQSQKELLLLLPCSRAFLRVGVVDVGFLRGQSSFGGD